MAQIFVSHSRQDEGLVNFLLRAFHNTGVNSTFEEFEAIFEGKVTSPKVISDIEGANAVFVILSQNVQNLPHTRDWVVWEAGIARNKDIWVFEPFSQFGSISVVVPYLRHYVVFGESNEWLRYIRDIIKSYDDSHVLPTALLTGSAGSGLGAVLSEKDRAGGALVGGLFGLFAGAILSSTSNRPRGIEVRCIICSSSYEVHIPPDMRSFRCPVCNSPLQFTS